MEELKRWRRDLHQIPELGLEEVETTEYLKTTLTKMGYETHPLKELSTGLYVYIDQGQEETIAFRTDIDALSVEEENDVSYKSHHPHIMHACGHDGHMSALLGFAYRLSQKKERYKNNILLIFQPAEEAPGAAKDIVESGLLNDYHVKAIYGIHLMPYIEEGDLYSKAGPLMAECGEIDIVIKGKGAHAGTPEQGHDAIIAASMLVAQFQTIHSRSISPFEDVVLNIGKINGGTARNAVAEEVKLEGTLRCYDEDVFMHVVNRMKEIAKGLEVAYDCDIDVTCDPMYPPLLNDETLFEKAKSFGVKQLKQPMMLAEDFAFYTKAVPSLFIYVGTKTKNMQSGLHTSTFNFNEEVLERAVDFYEYMLKESI